MSKADIMMVIPYILGVVVTLIIALIIDPRRDKS